MENLSSIKDLDLSPKPGKSYWRNCHREWREEFIYFLMVDRFHDDRERQPVQTANRSKGFGTGEQLNQFCGGTIRGIIQHLDYVHELGCTALWLSPVFENNITTYPGYAVQNYLAVDSRFGTKEDMAELVDKAHALDMRVFLDIVLNHSGDNWYYLGGERYYYYQGVQFPFGGWRSEDRPLPVELRNPDYYDRMGEIRHWDTYPETQDGDFFGFKGFLNDESENGKALQAILIKVHCYWIRECDFDGFRLDAVKHVGELAISRFCSTIREYAYTLGKRNFFLFGELVGGDEAANKYIGPSISQQSERKNIYYGLNSVLDFSLYYALPGVIKGKDSPLQLINRYEALYNNGLNRGELGRYLVTFLDNHDQVGQAYKQRFGAHTLDDQVIAGIGYLLCSMGTSCIYYGTEQGFSGEGEGDQYIREAMFDLENPQRNTLNKEARIYREIAKIALIHKTEAALRFGRMYLRETSADGKDFSLPQSQPCILAFSRILFDEEILIAYNTSTVESLSEFVLMDNYLEKNQKHYLYGGQGSVDIHTKPAAGNNHRCVHLHLAPMQLVVLK